MSTSAPAVASQRTVSFPAWLGLALAFAIGTASGAIAATVIVQQVDFDGAPPSRSHRRVPISAAWSRRSSAAAARGDARLYRSTATTSPRASAAPRSRIGSRTWTRGSTPPPAVATFASCSSSARSWPPTSRHSRTSEAPSPASMAVRLGHVPRMAVMARVSSPTFVARDAELADGGCSRDRSIGRPRRCSSSSSARRESARAGSLPRFAGSAEAAGMLVIVGGAVPLGVGTVPFTPIREAMRELVAALPPSRARRGPGRCGGRPRRLHPGARATRRNRREPDQSPGANARASARIPRARRARVPVLILEDLHWADRSTLSLLAFLIRNVRTPRLRLVGTLRTDEVDRRHPLHAFLAEAPPQRAGGDRAPEALRPGGDRGARQRHPRQHRAGRRHRRRLPSIRRQSVLRRGAARRAVHRAGAAGQPARSPSGARRRALGRCAAHPPGNRRRRAFRLSDPSGRRDGASPSRGWWSSCGKRSSGT